MRKLIRRCYFRPYRKGQGPVFRLDLFDTGRPFYLPSQIHYSKHGPRWRLAYELRQDGRVIFSGDDYGCSPLHAIDSDQSVVSLMSFLTLRPGDTDEEYFAKHTDEQREYCEQHAEALSCEVQARFCDDAGRVIERRRAS